MQIYALKDKHSIFVAEAIKGKDYLCPECQRVVRLRGGNLRQKHFYHHHKGSCRQGNKSLTHLALQWHLIDLLPKGEALMERAFPEIGRITDVCWEKRKIVFEIQCSPITEEKAKRR